MRKGCCTVYSVALLLFGIHLDAELLFLASAKVGGKRKGACCTEACPCTAWMRKPRFWRQPRWGGCGKVLAAWPGGRQW
eukprot:8278039-Lingulodinium_polyedra.AAC.1